jgi:hypothetical protein
MLALSSLLLASSSRRNSAAASSPPESPAAAFQVPSRPWTAVGSTGVVDEASLTSYAMGNADIGFKPNAPSNTIVARYNVTNTFDNNANPNQPGWHTLEMGSSGALNVIIQARLFELKACSAEPKLLCTAVNRSNTNTCARCTFNGPIDFTSNLYYVEVTLDRSAAPAAFPRVFTLRVF